MFQEVEFIFKYNGEKARETVNLLKKDGLCGSKILLLISPGSLTPIRQALQTEVREVISETSDNEDLLRSINSGIGVTSRETIQPGGVFSKGLSV